MKTVKKSHNRKKILQPKIRSYISEILIIGGVLLLLLWGFHRFAYNRAISLSDVLLASYANEGHTSQPIHIAIGKRISLPVVEAGKIDGNWTISKTSANHVRQSAQPGQKGNSIIYGHNTNKIFGFLLDVKVGDSIKIRMTDGTLYQYKATETHYVWPTQTELLAPTKEEILTLYTCAGLLDSLRFVVRAVPI